MANTNPLSLDALRGLVGLCNIDATEAVRALDETGACLADVAEEWRPVWAVVEERARRRQPLDAVAIREALKSLPPERLTESLRAVLSPETVGARERLALLHEAGVRTRLVEHMRTVAVAAKGGAPMSQLETLYRDGQVLLSHGTRVRNAAGDPVAMLDAAMERWRGQGQHLLMSGLGELDETIGGLVHNLIAIGARPGVGKSALVAGLVSSWVSQGHPVGVLAYEDDAKDMQARIIAHRAGVGIRHVKGDLWPNSYQQGEIGAAFEWWVDRAKLLWVDDERPSGTPADVLASMRAMAAKGCRVVILDNLTCVRMDQGADDTRHYGVERALADIRSEAQRLRLPAIVVGHLKRGQGSDDENQKPPRLSDFAQASAWENYARVALGMWRDGAGVRLRVLKQTNGPAWPMAPDFAVDLNTEAAVVTGTRALRDVEPEEQGQTNRRTHRKGAES